jgi:hypothetical protein
MVTYEDVLSVWIGTRDAENTQRAQELDLLVMRLRDAVRPDILIQSFKNLQETTRPIRLFDTTYDDSVCQKACERINASLPIWLEVLTVCGVMYVNCTPTGCARWATIKRPDPAQFI